MMSPRHASVRRSATEKAFRGLLAIIAVALGYVSVTQSLGYTFKDDSARAHILAPNDGRVTALLSQSFVTAQATATDLAEGERLARLALDQDPTAVRAATTLGLINEIRGHKKVARRLFAYADKLSRRELQTQLWAIEDAVERHDVAGALRQYDIALRTSQIAPDLLFPVLASAVADPGIRSALTRTLASDPAWGPNFTLYVSAHSPPDAAVSLFRDLARTGNEVTAEPHARLVNRLISSGAFADAWNYYSGIRRGASRHSSRDPRFQMNLAIPTPFDWTLEDTPGISSMIQPGERGGIFDFSAPASVGGNVLQQMQMLPPGDYRLEGHSSGIEQPEGSRPYWVLTCLDGRELNRVIVPNSTQAKGAFYGQFHVPETCPVQTLALVVRATESISGVTGQIDLIQLVPLR